MKKQLSSLIVIAVIGLIVIIVLSSSIFYTLQPGERGVIFRKFSGGLDKEHVFRPGFHVIAPWNKLYIYDVKEQVYNVHEMDGGSGMDVLDKNGLTIHVDATIRYYPMYDKIGHIHEKFGIQYKEKLIIPEARSSMRKVMGRFTAEEIYSTKRQMVEEEIIEETEKVLLSNNIQMKALLIRSIKLPPQIKKAIENKLEQEQEAAAMKYKLDKERQEAERRQIEAEGIFNYNKIISASLTDKILKQKGIDATIKLAESENSKIVIIGGGKEGLPLILNGETK